MHEQRAPPVDNKRNSSVRFRPAVVDLLLLQLADKAPLAFMIGLLKMSGTKCIYLFIYLYIYIYFRWTEIPRIDGVRL